MSSFISLLSENIHYIILILKFVEIFFVDHVMVYFGKYSMFPCKEWIFCSCWVLISPSWLIMLIKSSISLLMYRLFILSSTEMAFEISNSECAFVLFLLFVMLVLIHMFWNYLLDTHRFRIMMYSWWIDSYHDEMSLIISHISCPKVDFVWY